MARAVAPEKEQKGLKGCLSSVSVRSGGETRLHCHLQINSPFAEILMGIIRPSSSMSFKGF